ncbi:MAG: hypothetical protein LBM97_01355 [Candidatus Nomurabacteria bacterium]|jgi:hypothetical protein|nr:hypothetical protein [Candidatus Nomurabacteria bacterium]
MIDTTQYETEHFLFDVREVDGRIKVKESRAPVQLSAVLTEHQYQTLLSLFGKQRSEDFIYGYLYSVS